MHTLWDSDDRPEDYERYKIEHPPTIADIFYYGGACLVLTALVIAVVVILAGS